MLNTNWLDKYSRIFHYTTRDGLDAILWAEEIYSPSYYIGHRERWSTNWRDSIGDFYFSTWFTSATRWEDQAGYGVPKLINWPTPESVGTDMYRIAVPRDAAQWSYVSPSRRGVIHFATFDPVPIDKWLSLDQYIVGRWVSVDMPTLRAALERRKESKAAA